MIHRAPLRPTRPTHRAHARFAHRRHILVTRHLVGFDLILANMGRWAEIAAMQVEVVAKVIADLKVPDELLRGGRL